MPRSRTRWLADLLATADVPVKVIPEGVRALKPRKTKSKSGRPAKDGERYPSGKLKPEDVSRMAPALLARMKGEVMAFTGNALLESEIGRLSLLNLLTNAQTAAALRLAEIQGRYEWFMRLRRSAASPAYASGHGDPDLAEERMTPAQLVALEARIKSIKAEFTRVQDELKKVMSSSERAFLEEVVIENQMAGYLRVPLLKDLLDRLIGVFGEKWRHKKPGPGKAERKVAAVETQTAPIAPAIDPPAKVAFRMTLQKLRPDLDDEEIERAWRLHNGLTAAVADRARFRSDKSKG